MIAVIRSFIISLFPVSLYSSLVAHITFVSRAHCKIGEMSAEPFTRRYYGQRVYA